MDGVQQVYHVTGSGPIAVFHSGGPGIDWRYLRMPALEEHLTAVYLEPVGTSDSGRLPTHPAGYTIERYVRHLHGVVEALGVPAVHVVGHSHGGFVALQYALDHPERTAGLVLYSTSAYTGPEWGADLKDNLDAMVERFSDRPQMAAARDALFAGHEPTDEAFTACLQQALPAYFADYWAREEEWLPMRDAVRGYLVESEWNGTFDVRARLADIAARTLILVGRHDFICSPRWAGELHRGIAGAELVEFEGSGHFPHLEQPEAFTRAVASFVTAG